MAAFVGCRTLIRLGVVDRRAGFCPQEYPAEAGLRERHRKDGLTPIVTDNFAADVPPVPP
jgi:hypothetical protein